METAAAAPETPATALSRPRRVVTLSSRLADVQNVADPEIVSHRRPLSVPGTEQDQHAPPVSVPKPRQSSSHSALAGALEEHGATVANRGTAPSSAPVSAQMQSNHAAAQKRRHADTEAATDTINLADSSSDESHDDMTPPTPGRDKAKKRRRKRQRQAQNSRTKASTEPVGADGFLRDLDVQEINEPATTKDERRQDVDAFFGKPYKKVGAAKIKKMHHDCLKCIHYHGDVGTLIESTTWTFAACLPQVGSREQLRVKAPRGYPQTQGGRRHCKAARGRETLDPHLREMPPKDKVLRYTEQVFRQAVVEWLIATDQPISAVDHPKFTRMIEVAAAAKEGVQIPNHKVARAEIMKMFQKEISGLKKRLNSAAVTGEVSLTCDAWQAASVDAYFAVTAHWIEEAHPNEWEARNAIIGFTRLNGAHNGRRLGQALFKIVERVGIEHKIGHITCDNAKNNGTMLRELAIHLNRSRGPSAKRFDAKRHRVKYVPSPCQWPCLAHIINLATQALLATYSRTPHFNAAEPKAHLNGLSTQSQERSGRDEVGLIRAIAVKERSSAKRKDIFRNIQVKAGVRRPMQLLLDSKTRWSSTYLMLHRAEANREHVNTFIYKIAREEKDLAKGAKIDALRLDDAEWSRVTLLLDLLAVRYFMIS
ncbi:hypothetical protein NUW54_g10828 [Trametes sanguinea]|uniref:Uncharacterized protein n=1 Tax=Trametes sanguinea TaxID=158606 RepID=A0ACC1NRM3_9APHY|nr:hypothetical protein NUW54_g10828 [Trametes sanguinea]